MDFRLFSDRLAEDNALLEKLRSQRVDTATLTKIERIMVRDILVLMVTCYQENVKDAVMVKVKRHSNNNEEISKFISKRIKKVNMKIDDLCALLSSFNNTYSDRFTRQLTSRDEKESYGSILLGRINVAHDDGTNIEIGSLYGAQLAHQHAKNLLTKFEASLW